MMTLSLQVINYTEHEGSEVDSPIQGDDLEHPDKSTRNWKENQLTRFTGTELYVRHGTPTSKLRKVKKIVRSAIEDADCGNNMIPGVVGEARTGFCWCSMSDIAPQGIHFNVRYDIFATDLGVFRDIKEEINFLILEGLEAEGIVLVGPIQALNVVQPVEDLAPAAIKPDLHLTSMSPVSLVV